jgi:PEP-CTERM motif
MKFFRRTLIATTPAALGVLLFAGGASATTIIGSTTAYGNIAAFSAGPTGSTVSVNQFNQTSLDAAIQAACPTGDTCSASTLTEIDFSLQVNVTATVGVGNSNGITSYIGSITGSTGTFGAPTSGIAIAEIVTTDLNDGITTGLVEDNPTFSAATTNQFKSASCSGTPATSGSFHNCLAVASSGQSYSGTGTDTETGSYTGDLSGETSTYVGAGLVNFTLAANGNTTTGSYPAGLTFPTNTAAVTALTNGLVVTYDYSYTETSSPEPATMALVGGGLLLIGFIRKKRVSQF